jgi:pimeloyl-ACP methyl ester carboxylesterase
VAKPIQEIGLVWVHGIFGHPAEFTPVVPYFTQKGYWCHCVTLPAHGSKPSQYLYQLSYLDFVAHLQEEVLWAGQHCQRVCLIGHSLGGMLALAVAGSQPEALCGVVALGAAFEEAYLLNPALWLKAGWARFRASLPYVSDYWHGNDRPRLPLKHLKYFKQQGTDLLSHLQTQLPKITVPTLLGHSPYDLSVPYEEMHKLYDVLHAVGVPVTTLTLEQCGHQIFPLSKGQITTLAAIQRFVERL